MAAVGFTQKKIDDYHTIFMKRASKLDYGWVEHEYMWEDIAHTRDSDHLSLIDKLFKDKLFIIIENLKPLINPAEILRKDEKGNTILHRAVLKNDSESVQYLVRLFPDLIDIENIDGKKAFDLALGISRQIAHCIFIYSK